MDKQLTLTQEIVQEMVNPLYSGVCYSTVDPNNPKVIAEFVSGLSDELMC